VSCNGAPTGRVVPLGIENGCGEVLDSDGGFQGFFACRVGAGWSWILDAPFVFGACVLFLPVSIGR